MQTFGWSVYTKATAMILEELQRNTAYKLHRAQEASSEVVRLKQQSATEKLSVFNMTNELLVLRTEIESNKFEADHFMTMHRAVEDRRFMQPKGYLELEDAKLTIRELKEELAHENHVRQSLGLQLQKTIESNSELLLEIKDLEELLQERQKVIEELQDETHRLKGGRHGANFEDAQAHWMQRLQDSEEDNQRLKMTVRSLENALKEQVTSDADKLDRTIGLLRKDMVKLERDSQDIMQENANLLVQIQQLQVKADEKDALVQQLESELVNIQDQSFFKENMLEKEAENLQALVDDLKEKLHLLEELYQTEVTSSKEHLDDLKSSSLALHSHNEQLEIMLKCSEERNSSLLNELNNMREVGQEHEKERALLASQRGQLKCLREKLASMTEDYEKMVKKVNDLEIANTTLREMNNEVIANLDQDLRTANENLLKAQDEYLSLKKALTDREIQASKMQEEIASLLVSKEQVEATLSSLQVLNAELEEQLTNARDSRNTALQELHEREVEIARLSKDLATSQGQMKDMNESLSQYEASKEVTVCLKQELKDVMEELIQTKEDCLNLQNVFAQREAHTSQLEEQIATVLVEKEKAEVSLRSLEALNAELQQEVKHVQFNSSKAFQDLQEHELNTTRLLKDLATSQEQIKNMKERIAEAETERLTLAQKVQQIEEDQKIKKSHIIGLEQQLLATIEEKETLSKSFTTFESKAQKLQRLNKELTNELRDALLQNDQSKTETLALAEKLQQIQKDNNVQESHIKGLEQQLTAILEEKESLSKSLVMYESKAQKLQTQNNELTDNLQGTLLRKEQSKSELAEAKKCQAETRSILESTVQQLKNLKIESLPIDGIVAELEDKIHSLHGEKDGCAVEDTKHEAHEHQVDFKAFKTFLINERQQKDTAEASIRNLNLENARLFEELASWKAKAKTSDDIIGRLKHDTSALQDKVLQLQDMHAKASKRVSELDQRNELIRLRKQTNDLKRKISEHEEDKEELKKKTLAIQKELQRKTDLLALTEKRLKEKDREERGNGKSAKSQTRANNKLIMLPNLPVSNDAESLANLTEKFKLLQEELKIKTVELEATKFILRERETVLWNEREHLETVNVIQAPDLTN